MKQPNEKKLKNKNGRKLNEAWKATPKINVQHHVSPQGALRPCILDELLNNMPQRPEIIHNTTQTNEKDIPSIHIALTGVASPTFSPTRQCASGATGRSKQRLCQPSLKLGLLKAFNKDTLRERTVRSEGRCFWGSPRGSQAIWGPIPRPARRAVCECRPTLRASMHFSGAVDWPPTNVFALRDSACSHFQKVCAQTENLLRYRQRWQYMGSIPIKLLILFKLELKFIRNHSGVSCSPSAIKPYVSEKQRRYHQHELPGNQVSSLITNIFEQIQLRLIRFCFTFSAILEYFFYDR